MSANPTTVKTKEITRRDLLQMGQLSDALEENDALLLTKRGKLDAVILDPKKVEKVAGPDGNGTELVAAVEQRMERDGRPVLTDKDIVIMKAIGKLGTARLTEISEAIEQSPSNIHRPLQEMVDAGLVVRSEGEEITYRLTDVGQLAVQGGE